MGKENGNGNLINNFFPAKLGTEMRILRALLYRRIFREEFLFQFPFI